jgi:hypothetical protein
MRVVRDHRLNAVSSSGGQVGVVNSNCSQISDVAMSALVRPNVLTSRLLGRLPDVTVEGALAPEATSGGWEEEVAVGAVEVDLGFEYPSERGGYGTTRPASGSP